MQIVLAIANLVLAFAASVLLVPAAVLLVQLLAASFSPRPSAGGAVGGLSVRPSLAVLMPAHNEAAGIAAAIDAVSLQLRPGDRLLVVADNCSDDTAGVAAAAGAEVAQRTDRERRGKGYALDFGVRHLALDPPVVVVIVDADCEVHPGALDTLVRTCVARQRPTQALYLMRSAPSAGLKTRIAEFAWAMKNQARALGNHRLGLPCQLMGSGMAFTWPQISSAPLATGHIVEDLQLGLDMAAAGCAPCFCSEALVTSVFPVNAEGLTAQRTRWEHGYLDVMFTQGPTLLRQALVRGHLVSLMSALDLCVPPLALLVLTLSGMLVLTGAFLAATHIALPFVLSGLAAAALVVAVGLGWWRFGRKIISFRELKGIPGYVLNKLPMYLRALRARQVDWVRTRRDDGSN